MPADKPCRFATEHIDALVAFLPILERPDFIPSREKRKRGYLPSHVWAPELQQLYEVFCSSGFIYPFDWGAWQDRAAVYIKYPHRLRRARLLTLRKLCTVHVRKERFCEGHFLQAVRTGHMAAILRRLRCLRQQSLEHHDADQ